MSGKGSKRRPAQISAEEMQRRWEAAFAKPKEQPKDQKPAPKK